MFSGALFSFALAAASPRPGASFQKKSEKRLKAVFARQRVTPQRWPLGLIADLHGPARVKLFVDAAHFPRHPGHDHGAAHGGKRPLHQRRKKKRRHRRLRLRPKQTSAPNTAFSGPPAHSHSDQLWWPGLVNNEPVNGPLNNELVTARVDGSMPMKISKRELLALFAAAMILPAGQTSAQSWPSRPIRFIVTLGAGSGVDIGARLFADKLSERWGQAVVVENRPGGDGIVAITSVLTAHDDHTLLITPVSSFTAHPYFHDTPPYEPKDLIPVARISNTVVAVSVPTALNVNSLKELEALARAKPGQLNWTTATGFTDFVFAGFLHTVGLTMAKVPYKNPVAAVTDLAENRIQVYMPAYAIVRPQVLAGKIKVLAVTNHERAKAIPDIPTALELGYPSLQLAGRVGLFSSPDLPDAS